MKERRVEEFKMACREYFSNVSLHILRSYGRTLQLRRPTAMKKRELIENILSVLSGEVLPKRENKGAPIKDNFVDEKLVNKVNELKAEYLGEDFIPLLLPLEREEEEKAEQEEPVEPEEKTPTCVQFIVNITELNKEQREHLKTFLTSLSVS